MATPIFTLALIMTLSQKLLIASTAIGIICFFGAKIHTSSTDGLPHAPNDLAIDTRHERAGAAHPSQRQNASIEPSTASDSIPRQTKSNRRPQVNADKPNCAKDEDLAHASQVSPLRKSRKFSSLLIRPLEAPKPPASLVWIDGLKPEQSSAIQELAEEFKQNLKSPSQQSSSVDYARAYQDEARINDTRFQTRYGDQLWMRHHVAAHHLNSAESSEN